MACAIRSTPSFGGRTLGQVHESTAAVGLLNDTGKNVTEDYEQPIAWQPASLETSEEYRAEETGDTLLGAASNR